MDEKRTEEAKPKISRSQARHERRKRLLSFRRAAAEKDPTIALQNPKGEIVRSADSESPENLNNTESVSKSKARRLRKKNKTENGTNSPANTDNNISTGSPQPQISECTKKTLLEDICTVESKPNDEKELTGSRSGIIEFNLVTKKSESIKISATEHELLENEKNLKISETSGRGTTFNTCNLSETHENSNDTKKESNLEFIIKKELRKNAEDSGEKIKFSKAEKSLEIDKSPEISASSDRRKEVASNEVSLPNSVNESPKELPIFCTTTKQMSSDQKMTPQEKTREQIKAEREAKKAAKATAKAKGKAPKPEVLEKNVEPTQNPKETAKKNVKEEKVDEVDGEITRMTHQLKITEPQKKPGVENVASSLETKSKAELRAERRAKQEAQRAAKQSQIPEKSKSKIINVTAEAGKITTAPGKQEDSTKKVIKRIVNKENAHEVNLFKHLYHERDQALINVPTVNSTIHPAIVRLGVQYANKIIVGSNARCVALLAAIKQLIEDFERPSQADFTRGLEASLQESSSYLHHCRPLAVSMQNALRHLKWQMTQLHATTSDEEAKTKLGSAIDTYIMEQIDLADKAISITIQTKISNGDVILTYGYSSLINKILRDAYEAGRQFRVVVVDGRPWLEGREQLRRLAKHGIECSYVLINALSFIMPQISKVFLGAHAILANGAVMSRVGTAQVALMAKAFNVPVLVACETHKTCERVQTDSIVYNEIANADELAQNLMGSSKKTTLINWRAKKSLNLLNLTYDVTPADLVTAVVTELAILPCTSVPVILRMKPSEI